MSEMLDQMALALNMFLVIFILRLRPCRRPLGSRSSEFRIGKSEVGVFNAEAGIPKDSESRD